MSMKIFCPMKNSFKKMNDITEMWLGEICFIQVVTHRRVYNLSEAHILFAIAIFVIESNRVYAQSFNLLRFQKVVNRVQKSSVTIF